MLSVIITSAMWSLITPTLYKRVMKEYVGSKVVIITTNRFLTAEQGGGGTGFHVVAPSGKTYIMTNRHVCNGADKDGRLWVQVLGRTAAHHNKVIAMSDSFDLCLVEPIAGIVGLDLGPSPSLGEDAIYVGHPRLQPRTYDAGEVVGSQPITINAGVIGKEITEAQCKTKDSIIVEVPELFLLLKQIQNGSFESRDFTAINEHPAFKNAKKVRVCQQRNKAMVMTLMIYAGASGSPVVNSIGQVIGVVYAAPETGGWGYAVTMADVRTILNGR